MESVTRKELVEALCELIAERINEGCSSEAVEDQEALVNRYFAEVGEKITFSDYYSMRDRPSAAKRARLKEFGKRYLSEYFGVERYYGGPRGGSMKS